jgi:O-antigen ligase
MLSPAASDQGRRFRPAFLLAASLYAIGLCFFYIRYVPLVKPFQAALVPVLFLGTLLMAVNLRWGTLYFVFCFPLINNLPYFFGIDERTPHAPTALVLFLFCFLGWILYFSIGGQNRSVGDSVLKPIAVFSAVVVLSGIITFFRYANFFPFLSDHIYELTTSVFGVTAGGAIMCVVFYSLNYLTGLAFFVFLLSVIDTRDFLKRIALVFCFSTFLSLLFGLFQHFQNPRLGNNPTSIRQWLINATFKDALSFAAYLSMVAVFFLGLSFALRGRARGFSFLVSLLCAYMIFLSGSKIGFLSFLVSLLIFLVFSRNLVFHSAGWRSPATRRVLIVSVVMVFAVVVIFFGLITSKKDISEQSMTLARLRLLLEKDSLGEMFRGRADTLWRMAALMMRDYPLSGVGIGGYTVEVANYANAYKTDVGTPESAENGLLQVGSELGWVGVFLVLWIFWEISKQTKRSYMTIPPNDPYRPLFIGTIGGIFSFLINLQVHSYIGSYEVKYAFWLLVGVLFCLGRKEGNPARPVGVSQRLKIVSFSLIVLFAGSHLWNSTHSLSLSARTARFGLKQDFGLDRQEKTADGREFRWSKRYAGLAVKIKKPVMEISLHASHPDIQRNPVRVRIFLVRRLFREKTLLADISLDNSIWKTCAFPVSALMNREVILLIKVSRTWNPHKTLGIPDSRNLGVALGNIQWKDG